MPNVLQPGYIPYWILCQLHAKRPYPENTHLNFRCIVNDPPSVNAETGITINGPTKTIFNRNIPLIGLKEYWFKTLFPHLYHLNHAEKDPANAYYGVNARTGPHGNHKKHIQGYSAFYLDCDKHAKFTREQRQLQIQFWCDAGFAPTFVVSTGQYEHNGYHAIWALDRIYSEEEGEEFLKRMVAITGCQIKGRVFDTTRVLRLPGFHNRKQHWKEEKNLCSIYYPELPVIEESFKNSTLMRRYTLDHLKEFPPSDRDNIMVYIREAHALGGDYGSTLKELVKNAQHTDDMPKRPLRLNKNKKHKTLERSTTQKAIGNRRSKSSL